MVLLMTIPGGDVVVAKMDDSFHQLQQQQETLSDVYRMR